MSQQLKPRENSSIEPEEHKEDSALQKKIEKHERIKEALIKGDLPTKEQLLEAGLQAKDANTLAEIREYLDSASPENTENKMLEAEEGLIEKRLEEEFKKRFEELYTQEVLPLIDLALEDGIEPRELIKALLYEVFRTSFHFNLEYSKTQLQLIEDKYGNISDGKFTPPVYDGKKYQRNIIRGWDFGPIYKKATAWYLPDRKAKMPEYERYVRRNKDIKKWLKANGVNFEKLRTTIIESLIENLKVYFKNRVRNRINNNLYDRDRYIKLMQNTREFPYPFEEEIKKDIPRIINEFRKSLGTH